MSESAMFYGPAMALESVTPVSNSVLLVRFTQDVILVSPSNPNDGLNLTNYTLSGPGAWYFIAAAAVPGDTQAVELTLGGALAPGAWALTVANIQAIGGYTLNPPTTLPFNILTGPAAIPASGGAQNANNAEILTRHLGPGLVSDVNKGWTALVAGIANALDYLTYVGQTAFPQLFLPTATGIYLDYIAGGEGVPRPPNLGISDQLYSELAIAVRTNQLTENAYLQVLKVFFGADAVQANMLSGLSQPYALFGGENLIVTINQRQTLNIIFKATDFEVPGQGTAEEVAAAISFAFVEANINAESLSIVNPSTGADNVQLLSNALGLASAVAVNGGSAQNILQFPALLISADPARTWTVSSPSNGVVRWTTVGTTTTDLSLVLPGDYFVVTGPNFQSSNQGTWTVLDVSITYPGGVLTQYVDVASPTYYAQAGVVISSPADIIWYRPIVARVTSDGSRSVIVAHLDSTNQVNVVIPATSQVVNRQLLEAAYLQPITPIPGNFLEKFDDNNAYVTTVGSHGLLTGQQILMSSWTSPVQNLPSTVPPNLTVPVAGATQIYPVTYNAKQATASPYTPGQGYTQTVLQNGTILVAGGGALTGATFVEPITAAYNNAAIFHYAQLGTEETGIHFTYSWTNSTTMTTHRMGHTATLLPSGLVFVAGGNSGGAYLSSTELYDPLAHAWTSGPGMSNARMFHTATALPDGRVLLVGGFTADTTPSATVDIYDPTSNTISAASVMNSARAGHAAVLTSSTTVLVAGGRAYNSFNTATVTTENFTSELYTIDGAWAFDSPLDYSSWLMQPNFVNGFTYLICNGGGAQAGGVTGFNFRRYEQGRWQPLVHAKAGGPVVNPGGFSIFIPERNVIYFDTGQNNFLTYNVNTCQLGHTPYPSAVISLAVGAGTLLNGDRGILRAGGASGASYSADVFFATMNADQSLIGGLNNIFTVANVTAANQFVVSAPNFSKMTNYTTAIGGNILPFRALPRVYMGPYIFDTTGGVGITSTQTTLTAAISLHTQSQTIQVASTIGFPDAPGYIVIGFGLSYQTGPIQYFGIQDATHLLIDFGFTFPVNIPDNATVILLTGKGIFVPVNSIPYGTFWLTENAAGRLAAISTISSIAAAGAITNIEVVYPGDYGLGAWSSPTHGAQKLSDIVEIYAGNNIVADLAAARLA